MVKEAESNAADDQRSRELIEARNTADQVIYQTEKSLGSMNGTAPADTRQKLEGQIADLRQAMQGEDTGRIRSLTEAIQQAAMALGEAMYQQQPQPDVNGASHGEDEDIVEGEFEAA